MRRDKKTVKNRVIEWLNRGKSPLLKTHPLWGSITPSRGYTSRSTQKKHYRQPPLRKQPREKTIRKRNLNIAFICATYLFLITGAELLTSYDPLLGVVSHILILCGLLLYAAIEYDRNKLFAQFLMVLVIPPMIRILSLSMPIVHFSRIFWFILISIPIFIAVFTCMWLLGIRPKDAGLLMPRWRDAPIEAGVILMAVPFGIMEYLILKPSPLGLYLAIPNLIALVLIILVCTGFLEELSFRGLMQFTTLQLISKWWAILFVSAIFGVLHAGNLSFLDCLLAFSVGVMFSVVRYRTGSIYGITVSHGVINIILFVVAPLYL